MNTNQIFLYWDEDITTEQTSSTKNEE